MSDAIEAARRIVNVLTALEPPIGPMSALEDDALIVATALLSAVGKGRETCDAGASPRPSTAEKALREAAHDLANFAWSSIREIDCSEAAANLNHLLGNLRAALASPSTEGYADVDATLWIGVNSLGKPDLATLHVDESACQELIDGIEEGDVMLVPRRCTLAVHKQAGHATALPEPKASTS